MMERRMEYLSVRTEQPTSVEQGKANHDLR